MPPAGIAENQPFVSPSKKLLVGFCKCKNVSCFATVQILLKGSEALWYYYRECVGVAVVYNDVNLDSTLVNYM